MLPLNRRARFSVGRGSLRPLLLPDFFSGGWQSENGVRHSCLDAVHGQASSRAAVWRGWSGIAAVGSSGPNLSCFRRVAAPHNLKGRATMSFTWRLSVAGISRTLRALLRRRPSRRSTFGIVKWWQILLSQASRGSTASIGTSKALTPWPGDVESRQREGQEKTSLARGGCK